MVACCWRLERGDGPLIATAIHDGHALRPELSAFIAVSDAQRLREEDPHTGVWTAIAPTRIVATHSRFQVDLNRPRELAVYRTPEHAFGLEVWREPLPADVVARSLAEYDAFYAVLRELCETTLAARNRLVVFDLHSYNHRRAGPAARPDDPHRNPEINLGTGSMPKGRWDAVVERFMRAVREVAVRGQPLDVRQNVKFRGGHLSRWIHNEYPDNACAIAVEIKKFFMDEWSGELDAEISGEIGRALAHAAQAVEETL